MDAHTSAFVGVKFLLSHTATGGPQRERPSPRTTCFTCKAVNHGTVLPDSSDSHFISVLRVIGAEWQWELRLRGQPGAAGGHIPPTTPGAAWVKAHGLPRGTGLTSASQAPSPLSPSTSLQEPAFLSSGPRRSGPSSGAE